MLQVGLIFAYMITKLAPARSAVYQYHANSGAEF